jgi:acyl-CoA thioesterase FadM
MDNDVYGHVNNVVYYSWFDTAVNATLIEQGVLDIHAGTTIGLVVETQCFYFAPWPFRKPLTRAFAWPSWAAPACVTRWACLPKAKT